MFNLIVTYQPWQNGHGSLRRSRVLNYVTDHLLSQFEPDGELDLTALRALPTLFVQESQSGGQQLARIGTINEIVIENDRVHVDYEFDAEVPGIPNAVLEATARDLKIRDDFEFRTTHWSVKDTDLWRYFAKRMCSLRSKPKVFELSEPEEINPRLCSAMMPFDKQFDPVNKVLRAVVEELGLEFQRADDIWRSPQVMQDVVTLLDQSSIVLADCTNQNPNVFYEIGIAHAIGRHVLLLAQKQSDVPFDLQHLRFLQYANTADGLQTLSEKLRTALAELVPN